MTHRLKQEKIPSAAETPQFVKRISVEEYEAQKVNYTQQALADLYRQMEAAKHFKKIQREKEIAERNKTNNFKSPGLKRVFTPVKKLLKRSKSKADNTSEIEQLRDQVRNLTEKLSKISRDSTTSEDDENMSMSIRNIRNGSPMTSGNFNEKAVTQKLNFDSELNNENTNMGSQIKPLEQQRQRIAFAEISKIDTASQIDISPMQDVTEQTNLPLTVQNVSPIHSIMDTVSTPKPNIPPPPSLSKIPPPPLSNIPPPPPLPVFAEKKKVTLTERPKLVIEKKIQNPQIDMQLELQSRINQRRKALEEREKQRLNNAQSAPIVENIAARAEPPSLEPTAPLSQLEILLRERRKAQQKRVQSHLESASYPNKRARIENIQPRYQSARSSLTEELKNDKETLSSAQSIPVIPPPPPIEDFKLFSPRKQNESNARSIPIKKEPTIQTPRFSLQEIQMFDKSQLRKTAELKEIPKPSTPNNFCLRSALLQKFQSMTLSPESDAEDDNFSDSDDF